MPETESDPIKPWFIAAEELNEYIGIRVGHIPAGQRQPEWIFLRHTQFDGIGGFAHLLRERGAILPRLPQVRHPLDPSWMPLILSSPKLLRPRHRLKFRPMEGGTAPSSVSKPPVAVAWHIFDEATTTQVRRACRKGGFTVNSFLIKHMTKAIRPFLEKESAVVPWMMPVNLRGKVARKSDMENCSSYISVKVRSYETVDDIHRNIYKALGSGEHWANWYSYEAGRVLGHGIKKKMIANGRCMSEWCIGGFSNLGDWDPEKKITLNDGDGTWIFCPPVLRFQLIGTGCLTFQNRLSLMIQAHPELTIEPAVPHAWLQNWVKEIEMDLSSRLSDPVSITLPSSVAAA